MLEENVTWKPIPGISGVEAGPHGDIRMLDCVVCDDNGERFIKGGIRKQYNNSHGYLQVDVFIDGKWVMKSAHRLVAKAFIPNPDNLPQVNHKDCNRANNDVLNLEWCDNSYNVRYREKYGVSQTETLGHPVYAINIKTQDSLRFESQSEAGRKLGVRQGDISAVLAGKRKTAGGYWFVEDNGGSFKIEKNKLREIRASMLFRGGVYAINLKTQEVSRFQSQREAGGSLGIDYRNVNAVLAGKRKTAGGYWFVKDNGHAIEVVKSKLHDVGGTGLKL